MERQRGGRGGGELFVTPRKNKRSRNMEPCYTIDANSPKIGEGTYGTVYKVLDNDGETWLAVKRVTLEDHQGSFEDEVRILRELRHHPNIIQLFAVKGTSLYGEIVLEWMEDHDLSEHIKKRKEQKTPLSDQQICRFFYQILCAIDHVHSKNIMHLDIKPANILVRGSVVKLADFGMACHYERDYYHLGKSHMTTWYRAPEIILGARYRVKDEWWGVKLTPAVDIWGCACVLYEMRSEGDPLFPTTAADCCGIGMLMRMIVHLGTPTDEVWPGITSTPHYNKNWPRIPLRHKRKTRLSPEQELMYSMLVYDPNQRPTAARCLQSPYFENVHEQGF
jgi:serine/threonine protein kinase